MRFPAALGSQLTVLISILLLIHAAGHTSPASAADEPACQGRTATPTFEYPRAGRTLDAQGDFLFRVRPVEGATGYLWTLVDNGTVIEDAYQREPMPHEDGLADWVRGYMRYSAFVWEANHGQRSGIPIDPDGEQPANGFAVLRESAEHERFVPGDLEVTVRADVCGTWSEPAVLKVHVGPRDR